MNPLKEHIHDFIQLFLASDIKKLYKNRFPMISEIIKNKTLEEHLREFSIFLDLTKMEIHKNQIVPLLLNSSNNMNQNDQSLNSHENTLNYKEKRLKFMKAIKEYVEQFQQKENDGSTNHSLREIYDYKFYKQVLANPPNSLDDNDENEQNSVHWYKAKNVIPLRVGDHISYTSNILNTKNESTILEIDCHNKKFPLKLESGDHLYTKLPNGEPIGRRRIKMNDRLIDNPFDFDILYIDDYNLDPAIYPTVKESNPLSKLELFNTKPNTEDDVMEDEISIECNKNANIGDDHERYVDQRNCDEKTYETVKKKIEKWPQLLTWVKSGERNVDLREAINTYNKNLEPNEKKMECSDKFFKVMREDFCSHAVRQKIERIQKKSYKEARMVDQDKIQAVVELLQKQKDKVKLDNGKKITNAYIKLTLKIGSGTLDNIKKEFQKNSEIIAKNNEQQDINSNSTKSKEDNLEQKATSI